VKLESEVELARVVVTHFEAMGWDVYQEVPIPGGIADIVAVLGPRVALIECKLHLSLDLLAQLRRRRGQAHLLYAATPQPSSKRGYSEGRAMAEWVLGQLGVGLLEVRRSYREHGTSWICKVERDAALLRRAETDKIRSSLRPEHKTYAAAGSPNGGVWTPFRATCTELASFVAAHPGCSMREAIDGIRHHYVSDVSARSALGGWIERGKVPGVRAELDGRRKRLYPIEVWP